MRSCVHHPSEWQQPGCASSSRSREAPSDCELQDCQQVRSQSGFRAHRKALLPSMTSTLSTARRAVHTSLNSQSYTDMQRVMARA